MQGLERNEYAPAGSAAEGERERANRAGLDGPAGWTRIGAVEGGVQRDAASATVFGYVQAPEAWEHPQRCRATLGLVSGRPASVVKGNLVDVESDLRGITRTQTKCPAGQYAPACALGGAAPCPDNDASGLSFRERATGATVRVSTAPVHPPACSPWSYAKPGTPAPLTNSVCNPGRF